MSSKPLLLGLRRRDNTDGLALEPASGSGLRLLKLSGMPLEEYQRRFDRANASDLPDLTGRRVVVLGRGAWQRLGLPAVGWFCTRHAACGATLTLVPHPSGRCRLYNDPLVRERVRALLASL
jgi:hypothetical protein